MFTLGERTGYHVEGKEHTKSDGSGVNRGKQRWQKRERERINEWLIVTCTEHKNPYPMLTHNTLTHKASQGLELGMDLWGYTAFFFFLSFSFGGFSQCSSRCYLPQL